MGNNFKTVDIKDCLQVEPLFFKYLGEHYGRLVFVTNRGGSFVCEPNGDNSFLEVGKEYEMRGVSEGNEISLTQSFIATGLPISGIV